MSRLVQNAAGRMVPVEINGVAAVPYAGPRGHQPTGRKTGPLLRSCAEFAADGDKRVESIRQALLNAGLSDGMTISTHHHLRNGDRVANLVFAAAAELGIKDLRWFPSASFPCHEGMIAHMDNGVIHHIEGSLNGPLGDYCTEGRMRGTAVLRSHGGRWQAIQDGEVRIDIAVIAAVLLPTRPELTAPEIEKRLRINRFDGSDERPGIMDAVTRLMIVSGLVSQGELEALADQPPAAPTVTTEA